MFKLLVICLCLTSCSANNQTTFSHMKRVKPAELRLSSKAVADSTGRKLVFKHISYTM